MEKRREERRHITTEVEKRRDVVTKISGYCIGDEVVRGQYINDIAYTHSYLLYKWATKWAANDDTNASKTISLM